MSDRTDRIRAAVTSEWKTTGEIKREIGEGRTSCIHRTLHSEARFGLIESRETKENGRRTTAWRRIA